MADDTEMRFRLQRVAAYRELCRAVRRTGRENVFFALLMLFLAYITHRPGLEWVTVLYAGLALVELATGLFKFLAPSAEGLLVDGFILLLFAAFNFGMEGVRVLLAGGQPRPVAVFFGLFMLWAAVNRFRSYGQLRKVFADRPTADQIAWFDDLIREIRAADPESDELALDLPTRPHWKAKLLGTTAFFVSARGESVVVAGPDTFELAREKKDHGTGRRAARLRLYGQEFPEFEIDDASWDNYQRWLGANAGPPYEHHPAPPPPMIEVRDLSKWFRGADGARVTAVDAVRFTVRPGEVFGLLGPNGAGKTTTLRMLCTVLKPSTGTATVAGFDVVTQPSEVRRHVGFLSANTGVYDRMTAWEMVEYYGRLNLIPPDMLGPRMDELFDTLQMTGFRDVPGGKMSTGMKQKVSIARALIHDPPVLIFDEPTAGLDVLVQRAVLESIKQLRGRGKTVVFSTHIMREAEKLCDRVAIMSKGRIVVCGTLDDLRRMHNQHDLEELFFSLVN